MRKRIFTLTVLVLLGVRWAFPLDAQKKIGDFVHTAWTERDGASDDVRALAQTKDGYLWIGTTARAGSLCISTGRDGLRRIVFPGATKGRSISEFGPEAERACRGQHKI